MEPSVPRRVLTIGSMIVPADDSLTAKSESNTAPSVSTAYGLNLAIEEGDVTRLVALHQSVTHLGRGFSADLRLEDQSVSRRHAVIVDGGDGVRVLDDRSANGTFVNGRRVTEAVLRDRDVIRLGRVALVYRDVAG